MIAQPEPGRKSQAPEATAATSIDEVRRRTMQAHQRLARSEGPSFSVDLGETGTGKSYADGAAIRATTTRTLTLVPTHANCREVQAEYRRQGVEAACYPELSTTTCANHKEASAVRRLGLPHTEVVCPTCIYREGCTYLEELAIAAGSKDAIATQARAAIQQQKLTAGRDYIAVHETPLDLLCPALIADKDLLLVGLIAKVASRRTQDTISRGFYHYMDHIANELDWSLQDASGTIELVLPRPATVMPEDFYPGLYEAVQETRVQVEGNTMRLVLAAALGELLRLAVVVGQRYIKGQPPQAARQLLGIKQVQFPPKAKVVFNDATGKLSNYTAVVPGPVQDITTLCNLPREWEVVHIVPLPGQDITKGRLPQEVAPQLRGILYELPYKRIGLLTHQEFAKGEGDMRKWLGHPYASRLTMVDYYGSGWSRGSNEWPKVCDCLVVFGTPRKGPDAIRQELFRGRKLEAFRLYPTKEEEKAAWQFYEWCGIEVETGQLRWVKTQRYASEEWHEAYISLVRAELIQAIGRGRSILPKGIPVYVVTTEKLSLVESETSDILIALEGSYAPLDDQGMRILELLNERRVILTTREIAVKLGHSERWALEMLRLLAGQGRVRRVGSRGGWHGIGG